MVAFIQRPEDNQRASLEFQYGPLPPGPYIRTLQLQPGQKIDPVRCSLRTEYLKHAVEKYDALSYVWGPESPTQSIEIDGLPMAIRQNLFSFLIRLRSEDETVTLWADAICINQQDVQEKNQQVQQMQDVYKSCRTARVWLNVSSTEVEDFLELAQSSAKLGRPDVPTTLGSDTIVYRGMTAILESAYWTRLWIVQEVALSPRVEIYISDHELHTLEWSKLSQICENVDGRMQQYEYDESDHTTYSPAFSAAWNVIDSLNRLREGKRTDTLGAVVTNFGECSCFDARDRIYGLLGLVDDFTMNVDYSVDVTTLFKHVLRSHPPHSASKLAEPLFRALRLTIATNTEASVPLRIKQTESIIRMSGQLVWGLWPNQTVISDSYLPVAPIHEGDVLCTFADVVYPAQPGLPRFLFVLRDLIQEEHSQLAFHVAGIVLAFDAADNAVPPAHWGQVRPLLGSKAAQGPVSSGVQNYYLEVSLSDFAVIHSLYGFDYDIPPMPQGETVRGLAPDLRGIEVLPVDENGCAYRPMYES